MRQRLRSLSRALSRKAVARSPAGFWARIADENGEHLAAIARGIGAELDALADALDLHDRAAVESCACECYRAIERGTAALIGPPP